MKVILDNLKKYFGEKCAVNINHFEIGNGTMLGLVGNNGAGKTTLFRLILDLHKADEGHVNLIPSMTGTPMATQQVINPAESEEWKAITGSYIDEGFLIDYLTPEEYFDFIGKVNGIAKNDIEERLSSFDKFMGGEIMDQKKLIRNLSAGNKQKVGIIAAMLNKPQLLILDEPFNFLDPSSQSQIKHILKSFNEETGATILISSHNLNHTVDICPKIALLEHGIILKEINNENGNAEKELEEYFNVD
jgi:ABC-2 type transport system ATP-binding protein